MASNKTSTVKNFPPCPVRFIDIHNEAREILMLGIFDGLRFDFIQPIRPNFAVSHSVSLGLAETPSKSDTTTVVKIPTSEYAFGANFAHQNVLLVGRVTSDGLLNGRLATNLSPNISFNIESQLTAQPLRANCMANLDYAGEDARTSFNFGTGGLYALNYLQRITQNLYLGGQAFWYGERSQSGVGFAARYEDDEGKFVASGEVSTFGGLIFSYFEKFSEKFSVGTQFVCNLLSGDVTASAGYDYNVNNSCRIRGVVDSNGKVNGVMENRLNNAGLKFFVCGEIDHANKDHKFGIGMSNA